MEIIEVLEKGFDEQNSDDLPTLINRSAVRNRLKEISGKRVSAEVVEAMNLVMKVLVDDLAGSSLVMPGKTMTLQDVQLILGLRQDINITVGSFHVKKVSQRASKKMVQFLVRQAFKEVVTASENGQIRSFLDKHDVVDEDELEEDVEI